MWRNLKERWPGVFENAIYDALLRLGGLLGLSAIPAVAIGWLKGTSNMILFDIFVIIFVSILFVFMFIQLRRIAFQGGQVQLVTSHTQPSEGGLSLSPPEGYTRFVLARERGGIESEIRQASEVWFAAVAGAHLFQLKEDELRKIKRVIVNDPDSPYIRTLFNIQKGRGPNFPEDARRTMRLCKEHGIEVRVSDHPILNVVIYNPKQS